MDAKKSQQNQGFCRGLTFHSSIHNCPHRCCIRTKQIVVRQVGNRVQLFGTQSLCAFKNLLLSTSISSNHSDATSGVFSHSRHRCLRFTVSRVEDIRTMVLARSRNSALLCMREAQKKYFRFFTSDSANKSLMLFPCLLSFC